MDNGETGLVVLPVHGESDPEDRLLPLIRERNALMEADGGWSDEDGVDHRAAELDDIISAVRLQVVLRGLRAGLLALSDEDDGEARWHDGTPVAAALRDAIERTGQEIALRLHRAELTRLSRPRGDEPRPTEIDRRITGLRTVIRRMEWEAAAAHRGVTSPA